MTASRTIPDVFAVTACIVVLLEVCQPAGAGLLTWTCPTALNNNAATDAGGDMEPQLTTDGAGTWVAVWDSTETM